MLNKQKLLLIIVLEVILILILNYVFALFTGERTGTKDLLNTFSTRHLILDITWNTLSARIRYNFPIF